MPGPFRVVASMPTHDMGVCQPSKEVRELIIIRWANHKMPVVGDQTVAQKWQRKLGVSFNEYPFKRLVVLKFFRQRQPCPFSFRCHGSVEHVETSSARTYTGATRHEGTIKTFSRDVNLMSCVHFSFSLFLFNSPTSLVAVVPAGLAGAVNVAVTTQSGTSAAGTGSAVTLDAIPLPLTTTSIPRPTGAEKPSANESEGF